MTVLESKIRDAFGAIADDEQPPTSVSIDAARERGRSLLRWRRFRVTGTPVLAAAAVAAVALGGVLPLGRSDSAGHKQESRQTAPSATAVIAPKRLDPLVPYASFAWLPAGEALLSGGGDKVSEYLNIYAGRHFKWQLMVYAARACTLIDGAGELQCTQSGSGIQNYPLAGRAPAVNGHRAFWLSPGPRPKAGRTHQAVVWQYASNAWAELGNAARAHQSSETEPILEYTWDFGDGTSLTGANVDHAFTHDGTYQVRVHAMGLAGALSDQSQPLTIHGAVSTKYVPSAKRRLTRTP